MKCLFTLSLIILNFIMFSYDAKSTPETPTQRRTTSLSVDTNREMHQHIKHLCKALGSRDISDKEIQNFLEKKVALCDSFDKLNQGMNGYASYITDSMLHFSVSLFTFLVFESFLGEEDSIYRLVYIYPAYNFFYSFFSLFYMEYKYRPLFFELFRSEWENFEKEDGFCLEL